MGLRELFSKDRKAKDVYQYDFLPPEFKAQVVHIWGRLFGRYLVSDGYHMIRSDPPEFLTDLIIMEIAEQHGTFFRFNRGHDDMPFLAKYFFSLDDIEKSLQVIQIAFQMPEERMRPNVQMALQTGHCHPDTAISELNQRFRQHGIGYQYSSGRILKVNSQYLHSETIKPALELLAEMGFSGVEDEFIKAHAHYKIGNYKESMNESLKALESTIKTICKKKGWAHKEGDTIKPLVDLITKKQLIPEYLQKGLEAINDVLLGLVPKLRNRTSGHGQGAEPLDVPEYFASYGLHITASSIVFLVSAFRDSAK